ncbi:hypothetical protein GXP67_33795 [Rhodocytophaga rosea]|uniref:Uncharacterized protein n=1 Tax=Rhodocytophaga rosea TaxID=2704465 RepID=A0A6C0GTC3_9BACT|nr:hypothetical protein [Rhodocytophaga rosea]QHT71276.1 hypothetical protein GXP67_33795 [Rhodocytophaga rosea]
MGFLLLSCQREDVVPGQLLLRIKNATSYQFDEVYVNTSNGENLYGILKASSTSDYKEFEAAYRYAYIKLKIQGEEFVIQPIDYVGEELLTEGKYTYVLSMYDYENKLLQLEFKKE